MLYKVVKYYQDPKKKARAVRTGLYLEEAKEYCSRPTSHGVGWFYGFTQDA